MPSGKPTIKFYGNSRTHLLNLISKEKTPEVSLTITEEYPYAQAIVTISSR
jgi:holo-[acyl-carrier protein] synthase